MSENNTPAMALAMSALMATTATLRVLAEQGLLAPSNVEAIYDGIMEIAKHANMEAGELLEAKLQRQFADMRQIAAERWRG